MKMKRFSTGKDNVDFTKPCKLTRQKRWTENPQEFVRLEHKAFNYNFRQVVQWRRQGTVNPPHQKHRWFESNPADSYMVPWSKGYDTGLSIL